MNVRKGCMKPDVRVRVEIMGWIIRTELPYEFNIVQSHDLHPHPYYYAEDERTAVDP
jgi:hypothetical protein